MDGDAEGDASRSNGVGGGGFSRVVIPVRGRLVVFSSGEENVHAVGRVTAGERVTLNLWLSMDPRVAADDDW
jgi:predicted 2-oxoglutarate/Fe(II)-dependent dioxygenase YbiX